MTHISFSSEPFSLNLWVEKTFHPDLGKVLTYDWRWEQPVEARHHAFHDLLHRAGISRSSVEMRDNRQAFQRAFVAQGRGFTVDGECFAPFHLQK
jgi:hypothetical protein